MKQLLIREFHVRFSDVDSAGILFFARTFEFAHLCLEEFCRQADFGWEFWFQNPEFAVPLKHASCEYLTPIRQNQKFNITMSIVKNSTSTLTFAFDFSVEGRPCARVETVHIFVDKKSFQKCAVPKQISLVLSAKSI